MRPQRLRAALLRMVRSQRASRKRRDAKDPKRTECKLRDAPRGKKLSRRDFQVQQTRFVVLVRHHSRAVRFQRRHRRHAAVLLRQLRIKRLVHQLHSFPFLHSLSRAPKHPWKQPILVPVNESSPAAKYRMCSGIQIQRKHRRPKQSDYTRNRHPVRVRHRPSSNLFQLL